jgi:hypothetical protein
MDDPLTSRTILTWILPTAVSLLITIAAWATMWGEYSQRVTYLESNQKDMLVEVASSQSHIATHDAQIAVINTKLDTIIQQLAVANAKLDRSNK